MQTEQIKEVLEELSEGVKAHTEIIQQLKGEALHSKKIIHEYKLSLFPANHSVEHYKIVFKWVAVIIATVLLFFLGWHWLNLAYNNF